MTSSKKYILLFFIIFTLAVSVFVAGLTFGSVSLSLREIAGVLSGSEPTASIIVLSLRLPRMLAAALAGMSLAAAGTILQCVTDNTLCAPNIIGINAGAGFAVMLMLCLAPMAWRLLPIGAFAGALAATAIVMGIAFHGGHRTRGTTIVLSGVAISSILSAGISFLSLRFPDVLSSYTAFSVGGFSGVRTRELPLPAIIIVLALLTSQLLAPKLNLLCLGDDIAASLGIHTKRLRIVALVAAAALCAAAVSFAGLLGFVGLIVPHIVRHLAGNDIRFNMGLSALCGAALVMASDLIGRVAFAPSELPAGIIMALLGAPFFLYLLMKRRNRYGRM